jgi:hypothetical protein
MLASVKDGTLPNGLVMYGWGVGWLPLISLYQYLYLSLTGGISAFSKYAQLKKIYKKLPNRPNFTGI